MNFDGLIPALQAKKVDMIIAGMTVTEERKNFINFSTPYVSPNIWYIVLKDKGLNSSKDLENKKFGVELGTTEESIARKVPGSVVISFTGHTAALLALKANKIDAILLDETVAQKYMENNPEIESIGVTSGESKAMSFNKSDENYKNIAKIKIGDGDEFLKFNESSYCTINKKLYKILAVTMDNTFIAADDSISDGDEVRLLQILCKL